MKAFKKFAAVVIAAGVIVTMSSCGAELQEDGSNSSVKVYVVSFPDNSKVDCLLLNAIETGGVKCAFGRKSIATETHDRMLGSFESIAGDKIRCVTYDGVKEGGLDCEMERANQ